MTAPTRAGSGATTAPESQPAVTLQELRQESVRLAKRWRMQAIPLAGMVGTHAVGAAAAALDGPVALLPVAAGWAGAAGAYTYAHAHTGRWGRVYAGIGAVGSAMFQAGIGFAGWDSPTAAAMWAVGCIVSVPWWLKHSEKDPDVTAEFAAPVAPTPPVERKPAQLPAEGEPTEPSLPCPEDPRVTLWNEWMAAPGKPLAGSTLTDIVPFEYGWKGTVTLGTTEHWHATLQARKAINALYNLPESRVFVESINGESVRRCRITVLERDPLQEKNYWAGPGLDLEEGSFPLMVTADADVLHFQLWNPGEGAAHALVSGGTRSGKTKVLDVILTECSMSDRVLPLICDGGGGASLPQWIDRVHLFGKNLADSKKILKYAIQLMEARRPFLIEQGGGSIEPSPEHPLIPIVIDEAHKYLMVDAEFKRLCEIVAQEGAKFAMGLILATQVPSAKQLGGSTVLRDQVKTGTVIGLRTTEGTSETMIAVGDPMPEKLKELPARFANGQRTRGLGYVMTDRKIRSRSLLLENPKDYPVTETRLERALAAVPVPAMDGKADGSGSAPNGSSNHQEPSAAEDAVLHALAEGTAKNPVALVQATGLSLNEVRRVLAELTD